MLKGFVKGKYLAAAFFALAAILLFVNLGSKDYWGDEIFSLPKMHSIKVVFFQSAWDIHPPLFFIFEYYWIELFGQSEAATRTMSALFAFGAVILAFKLAKRFLPNKYLNHYLILLATSPFFLFYARMNRYYAVTGFLCLLTIIAFLNMLEKKDLRSEIYYWLSILVLIYEDYMGFFLAAGLTLYYFIIYLQDYKKLIRYTAGGLITLILYVPWISNLLHMTAKGYMSYPEARPAEAQVRIIGMIIYNTAQTILRVVYTVYNFTLGENVYPWSILILPGLAGLAILFFRGIKLKDASGKFFLFAMIVPFALYILMIVFYKKVFAAGSFALIPSKLFFLQPLWLLFLLRGKSDWNRWMKTAFALLLIFNIVSIVNYHRNAQYLNPKFLIPWKTITSDFVQDYHSGDIIITDEEPLLYYLKQTTMNCYGIVGAVEYIAEQKPPFKVKLAVRRRGEESIFEEGIKLKEHLTEIYGVPEYKGYCELKGMQKKLWGKNATEDVIYNVMVYTFYVK